MHVTLTISRSALPFWPNTSTKRSNTVLQMHRFMEHHLLSSLNFSTVKSASLMMLLKTLGWRTFPVWYGA